VTGEAGRQRLHEQGERESLVPELEAAQGQDRALPRAEQDGGIVRRAAVRVHQPLAGQAAALVRHALGHRVRGGGHADVEQDGLALGGQAAASGFGVTTDVTPPCAATPAPAGSEQVRMITSPRP
jgi:hypothetical protein